MNFRKSHPLVKIINGVLVDLPAPVNLSINWNYGSLLGLVLVVQLVSGLLLTTRYSCDISISFSTIIWFQDIHYGWLIRLIHSTGATFFFIFIYLHIGRGLYYGSYVYPEVWNTGVVMLFLLMGIAFLGYVLPWGNMSFWGATVITNMVTAVPFVGKDLVEWIWGGFTVSNPTLLRFYTLHFLLPFVLLVLVVLHIFYLHETGSTNPLGVASVYKVSFHYLYSVKDLLVYFIFFFLFCFVTFSYGYSFMDAENWVPANTDTTPHHIQPEWYFLFAYAILRSIPNKVGGVLALVAAVAFLFLFSIRSRLFIFSGVMYDPVYRFLFWSFVSSFLCLTWLGSVPALPYYTEVALWVSEVYFFLAVTLWVAPHIDTWSYFSEESDLGWVLYAFYSSYYVWVANELFL